jgi:CRISPR-associated endonuclease/helicase Cas3
LAARLIGTSHGHGRHQFPHPATGLLNPDNLRPEELGPDDHQGSATLAADLFDRGGWDELIEHTHHRWGIWGCAYLEALLRAADCQTSRQGR